MTPALIITCVLVSPLTAVPPAKTEPTNAAEAAAKKAAADMLVDEQYAAWVNTLPPDQQAWERVFQENLGSFYLPIHKRQKVAGQSNPWDFVEDDPDLPRVLLNRATLRDEGRGWSGLDGGSSGTQSTGQ